MTATQAEMAMTAPVTTSRRSRRGVLTLVAGPLFGPGEAAAGFRYTA
jgi:hypothetical protein